MKNNSPHTWKSRVVENNGRYDANDGCETGKDGDGNKNDKNDPIANAVAVVPLAGCTQSGDGVVERGGNWGKTRRHRQEPLFFKNVYTDFSRTYYFFFFW